MLAFLALVTNMFFAPERGIEEASRFALKKVLLFYFFFLLLIFPTTLDLMHSTFGAVGFLPLFICEFFVSLIAIFVFALLISGLCEMLFGKAVSVKKLFSVFVFCKLPFLFLPILFLFLGNGESFIFTQAVLVIWSFLLLAFAIKKFYNFGVIKVFLVMLLPTIFIGFCIMLLFVFIATIFGGILN